MLASQGSDRAGHAAGKGDSLIRQKDDGVADLNKQISDCHVRRCALHDRYLTVLRDLCCIVHLM